MQKAFSVLFFGAHKTSEIDRNIVIRVLAIAVILVVAACGGGGGGSGEGQEPENDDAPDTVSPEIEYAFDAGSNISGWHKEDVRIEFICRDDESGIQFCSQPASQYRFLMKVPIRL